MPPDGNHSVSWLTLLPENMAALRWEGTVATRGAFGTAINHHLKPHLVRSTLDSCRGDAIEGHSG